MGNRPGTRRTTVLNELDSYVLIRNLMDKLEVHERTILHMRIWLGYTEPEIAKAFECKSLTIHNLINKILLKLRRMSLDKDVHNESDYSL